MEKIKNLKMNEETIMSLIKEYKDEPKLMFKLIKSKLNKDLATKILFSLFTDEYKEQLTLLEKQVKRDTRKIEKESKWKLVDRREFIKYYEDIDHTCKAIRIFSEFLPTRGASCDVTPEYVKREIWFYNWFYFSLKRLGSNLYDEEIAIENAIRLGLKNPEDYDLAVALADYVNLSKYIPKEKEKQLIK